MAAATCKARPCAACHRNKVAVLIVALIRAFGIHTVSSTATLFELIHGSLYVETESIYRGPEILRVFSNCELMRVIMPNEDMKARRDKT